MRYLLLLLLCGCSYTYQIPGAIGSKRFYKVTSGGIFVPAQSVIVVHDTNTHEITFMSPAQGNGALPALTAAGGIVAGSYVLGSTLKPDKTIVNQNSAAQSAPVVTVQDPLPGPIIPAPDGVGPPFGSKQNFPRNRIWSK